MDCHVANAPRNDEWVECVLLMRLLSSVRNDVVKGGIAASFRIHNDIKSGFIMVCSDKKTVIFLTVIVLSNLQNFLYL
jgi:hypothetical protein